MFSKSSSLLCFIMPLNIQDDNDYAFVFESVSLTEINFRKYTY